MQAYKSRHIAVVICAILVNRLTVRSYRDGFYGSNDPTNSVKALKEDRVLRIRLQSYQVHTTVLQL